MAKLTKEEQKKQNKITLIMLIIAIPIAVVIGLSLKKDKDKKEVKEAEEITLLKQTVSQYTATTYTFPTNEDDYVIDYDAFTKYINNGNSYLKVTCTLKDADGNNCIVSATYTSNDKVLHYLSIRDDVLFDDHTTDKE